MAEKVSRRQQGIWDPHDRAEAGPAHNSLQPVKVTCTADGNAASPFPGR